MVFCYSPVLLPVLSIEYNRLRGQPFSQFYFNYIVEAFIMPQDDRLLFPAEKYITPADDDDDYNLREGSVDWEGLFRDYNPAIHRMDIMHADGILHFAEQFST